MRNYVHTTPGREPEHLSLDDYPDEPGNETYGGHRVTSDVHLARWADYRAACKDMKRCRCGLVLPCWSCLPDAALELNRGRTNLVGPNDR